MPSCSRFHEQDKRSGISSGYVTRFENFMRAYRAGIRPLRPRVEAPIARLITMTLRESSYWPIRNSRLVEWCHAALLLQEAGFRVVVVRDTERADEPLPRLKTAPEASRNLDARASLYRSAASNLFVSNGPAWFCLALDAPTIILRPATENAGTLSSKRAMHERFGLADGLPNAPAHQRLIWAEDTTLNIVAAALGRLK